MSSYQEFTGKSVEEALKAARDEFGVGLQDLDFEILSPGSRGVLGMGAEPARIVAAPRSELGGAAPKREAAEAKPLPPPPPREDRGDRPERGGFRDRGDRGDRGGFRGDRDRDRGPRRDDTGPRRDAAAPAAAGTGDRDRGAFRDRGPRRDDRPDRGPRRDDRGPRRDDRPRRAPADLSETEAAEVAEAAAARGSLASERA